MSKTTNHFCEPWLLAKFSLKHAKLTEIFGYKQTNKQSTNRRTLLYYIMVVLRRRPFRRKLWRVGCLLDMPTVSPTSCRLVTQPKGLLWAQTARMLSSSRMYKYVIYKYRPLYWYSYSSLIHLSTYGGWTHEIRRTQLH